MGSVGANKGTVDSNKGKVYSGLNEVVSNRINTIINDSYAMAGEQTISIGQRNSRSGDTLLNSEQKKILINEVKDELKKRKLNKKVSITTPKLGPNMYSQYLKIY